VTPDLAESLRPLVERLESELARLRPVYAAACAEVDRAGPLLAHERRRDPLCVAVDAARGLTAEEAVAAAVGERGDGDTTPDCA
jgi:hypothetical protein